MMKNDLKNLLEDIWEKHRGASAGAAAGVMLAVSILLFGFWPMLFIVLCGIIGMYLGRKIDRGENVLGEWKENMTKKVRRLK